MTPAAIARKRIPLAASVSTKGAPEPRPTDARNNVRPNVRSVRFAGSGRCHASGPVRPNLPRTSATTSGPPASPIETLPIPGIGNWMRPSNTPSDMPSPTEMYETSVVDLMESPKCFRSPAMCWRAAITATRSPNSSTRSGSASNAVSPRRTSTTLRGHTIRERQLTNRHARERRRARRKTSRCPARCGRSPGARTPRGPSCLAGVINRAGLPEQQQHVAGIEPDQRRRAACWSVRAERPPAARRAAARRSPPQP